MGAIGINAVNSVSDLANVIPIYNPPFIGVRGKQNATCMYIHTYSTYDDATGSESGSLYLYTYTYHA